jgi:hypothetical protein
MTAAISWVHSSVRLDKLNHAPEGLSLIALTTPV